MAKRNSKEPLYDDIEMVDSELIGNQQAPNLDLSKIMNWGSLFPNKPGDSKKANTRGAKTTTTSTTASAAAADAAMPTPTPTPTPVPTLSQLPATTPVIPTGMVDPVEKVLAWKEGPKPGPVVL